MQTHATPAEKPEPDIPEPRGREWPEAVASDPIAPELDPEAAQRRRDHSAAVNLAARSMGVTTEAVRDALYIQHHDPELFELVRAGDVHLEDAKGILAGATTLEQARELAPIRDAVDNLLERAERNPEILERLEALLTEFENDSEARPAPHSDG